MENTDNYLAIINTLKGIDLSTTDKKVVHELVDALFPQIWLNHPLHAGTIISRCRKDPKNLNRESFSYKPAKCVKDFERATIPYSCVFYGSVGDDQHYEYGDTISLVETSQMHRDNRSKGRERIFLSKWRVSRDIPMTLIVHDKVFIDDLRMGRSLNSIQIHYREKIKEIQDKSKETIIDKVTEFISTEYAKKVSSDKRYEYMISAYFADRILNGENTGGIIYPSVQVKGQLGFNVALKPSVVDNNLEYLGAEEYILYKNHDYMPVPAGVYDDNYLALSLEVDSLDELPWY